jgi:hypothetical protein
MAHIAEIEKAIGQHSKWKAALRHAIQTGQIDTTVEAIQRDDHCFFGQWLDGPALTAAEMASRHYKTVKERHAEFHKTAARVLELVLAGKRSDAERMMSIGGEYSKMSALLTLAMMEWKKSLG